MQRVCDAKSEIDPCPLQAQLCDKCLVFHFEDHENVQAGNKGWMFLALVQIFTLAENILGLGAF